MGPLEIRVPFFTLIQRKLGKPEVTENRSIIRVKFKGFNKKFLGFKKCLLAIVGTAQPLKSFRVIRIVIKIKGQCFYCLIILPRLCIGNTDVP